MALGPLLLDPVTDVIILSRFDTPFYHNISSFPFIDRLFTMPVNVGIPTSYHEWNVKYQLLKHAREEAQKTKNMTQPQHNAR